LLAIGGSKGKLQVSEKGRLQMTANFSILNSSLFEIDVSNYFAVMGHLI
jgi:hypothetical protein